MTIVNVLSKAHAGIWFEHDAQNYGALEENALVLTATLYPNLNTKVAVARCIKNAYWFYDKATIANNKGDLYQKEYTKLGFPFKPIQIFN